MVVGGRLGLAIAVRIEITIPVAIRAQPSRVTVGPTPVRIRPSSGDHLTAAAVPPAYSAATEGITIDAWDRPTLHHWTTAAVTNSSGTSGHSRSAQPTAPFGEKPSRSTNSNTS